MSRERRVFERRPIQWNATLYGSGMNSLPVTIRDFCAGGFFLEPRGADPHRDILPGVAQDVRVRFFDPENRATEVQARIVRRTAHGLGVAFHRQQAAVVATLEAIAENQQTVRQARERAAPRSRLTDEVLRLCHEHVEGFCQRTLPDFAAHAVDSLFERARSASSNQEQNAYFAAYRLLRDLREEIPKRYTAALLARVDSLAGPRPPDTRDGAGREDEPTELALVDEREFANWLSRSEIIHRAEKRFIRELEALNRRLTYVVGCPLDETDNPLAPAGICQPLTDTLPLERFDNQALPTVYEVFGKIVMASLGTLYEPLNTRLRERGVLPEVEKERPAIRPLGGDSGQPVPPPAETTDFAAAEPDLPRYANSPESDPATEHSASIGLNWERRTGTPTAPAGHTGATPILPPSRHLLDNQRWLRENRIPAPGSAPRGGPATSPASAPAGTQQIIEALGRLQHDATGPRTATADGLMDRVLGSLHTEPGGGDPTLAADTRDAVELLDQWFGDIQDNALNTQFLREWSSHIAVLALRVQLESGDFLSETPQPIHHLLNQIDRAGLAVAIARGDERDRLQREISGLLEKALTESHGEPGSLETTAERIGTLIERPLQARAANVQRVLQQCEGSQRLARARRRVNEEIDRRLAGRQVPVLLLDFLEQGWRAVMALVLLRAGGRSDDWRRVVAVLDRLIDALGIEDQPGRPIAEPEKVLAFAQHQLTKHGRLHGDMSATLASVCERVLAVHRNEPDPSPLPTATAPEQREDAPEDGVKAAPRWLEQARLLQVGDWVYFSGRSGTPEPLRLQWVADEGARFVFVNRSGHKAKELSLAELAQQLEAAAAGVAEDMDQPLTRRQWLRRLQSMHEQMVRYATTDSLTGLLNRKALLREIEQLVATSDHRRQRHALICLSLDGFKVINSNLGNEVGDEVLRSIAKLLREAVGSRGTAGRVGGDEFALMLRDCSAAEAEVFAEECRGALSENRIIRGNDSLAVSASVGVAPFRTHGQSAASLLQDADEACLAAKQAGGNRIHLVTANDRELTALRTNMERAARVDTALELGRLRLRCQRIQPIVPDSTLKPSYEVLVAMQGDDGKLIPPDEFIPAAESFGRMTAVDRWVIREVLRWTAEHRDLLERTDGFSVNLSGPTLNDDHFAEFLRACLKETDISGEYLSFEVTETAAVRNLSRAAALIQEVKTLGCRFSLDDFGTGLSSYAYLKKLPVDYLKIDGQFIRDINHSAEDHAMVRSINDLGHFLGKRTVAEYVENDEILYQLRDIGLDFAQGFGVERPIPIDELEGR